MSHDQLRALMEHAHDAGCVNLSAFTQLLTELDLDDEEVSSLYEQLEQHRIELEHRHIGSQLQRHFVPRQDLAGASQGTADDLADGGASIVRAWARS